MVLGKGPEGVLGRLRKIKKDYDRIVARRSIGGCNRKIEEALLGEPGALLHDSVFGQHITILYRRP